MGLVARGLVRVDREAAITGVGTARARERRGVAHDLVAHHLVAIRAI